MEPISKKISTETAAAIDNLAYQYEPELKTAINTLLENYGEYIDEKALLSALQSGNSSLVIEVLNKGVSLAESSTVAIGTALQHTAAGVVGTAAITANYTEAQFMFRAFNPLVIDWAHRYGYDLIQEIGKKTREGIKEIVKNSLREGIGPIEQAREIKSMVGLTQSQAKAVNNFRKNLESFHLKRNANSWGLGNKIDRVNGRQVWRYGEGGQPQDGILTRRLRDFRYDGQLRTAMKTGKPLTPEQINKMVAAYQRKFIQHRARTIARTESLRATNKGIRLSFQNAVKQGQVAEDDVTRDWILALDERTCPTCSAIPKMNPNGVGLNEPFKTPIGPVMEGPIHPECRCTQFIRINTSKKQ